MALVAVTYVETDPERLALVALLEAHEIPCFVQGGGFGGLYPGLQINNYNTRRILVPEEALEDARQLVAEFRQAPSDEPPQVFDWLDNLRCIAEFFLGGWVLPQPRAKRTAPNKSLERTRDE